MSQRLIVMRHGLRLDEVLSSWVRSAARPWDSPLAPDGIAQVQEVAKRLSDLEIRVVVTSPYLRCLQTTRLVLEELLPNVEKIEVDLSLGELATVAHCANHLPSEGESTEHWMWQGADAKSSCIAGLDSVQNHSNHLDLEGDRFKLCGQFPHDLPETLAEARRRYRSALEAAADRANGSNILVITHGETAGLQAVGSAVTRLLPQAFVYEVRHCGFSIAERQLEDDGEYGFWSLSSRESHLDWGVKWY